VKKFRLPDLATERTTYINKVIQELALLCDIMSILFDIAQSVDVSFAVKLIPEKNGIDTVLVGKDIWTRFEQSGRDRVGLSIRPIRLQRNSKSKGESLGALTCWAVLDEEVGSHFSSSELISCPSRLPNSPFRPNGYRHLAIYFVPPSIRAHPKRLSM